MRDAYSLSNFFRALAAWEKHLQQYLAALELAHAANPSSKELENYRRIFLESYLEALADADENQKQG